MTRIIQISDMHIVAPPALVGGQVDTRERLERALERIRELIPLIGPVDLILATGDLVDLGRDEDYRAYRAIFDAIEAPFAAIPGNHDRREALRAAFADNPLTPAAGPIDWVLDLKDFRVIGLDTLVEGQAGGALGADSLEFLRAALDDAADRPALVALHHPPFLTGVGFMDRIGLANAEEFGRILEGRRAETRVICGHVHRHITGSAGGWPALTAPSTAHAIAVDYRPEAKVGFMVETGGFLIHEWIGAFRTTHVSVDPGRGPYSF
ncbi:phosphodiesterase [Pikeienuella sp. HZG-20]|uniref:phosphodiesterase n=1 Tax=Paludibacillus litoralis TaxID=3133267 RepID=UPI0030EDB59B